MAAFLTDVVHLHQPIRWERKEGKGIVVIMGDMGGISGMVGMVGVVGMAGMVGMVCMLGVGL